MGKCSAERVDGAWIGGEDGEKLQNPKWHRASEWRVAFSWALSLGHVPKGARGHLKTLKQMLPHSVCRHLDAKTSLAQQVPGLIPG